MDPKIIGERIKQSYPQYQNIDSATLGNKYLQKYGGAVSGVQSGKLKLTDIPEAQRVGVSLGIEAPSQSKQQTEVNEVKDTIGNIDTILGKNLGLVTGKSSFLTLIPGTEGYDTRRQIQQVKDQLSLASVGKLKGQGQVSDAERKMLANASTALDVGMSETAFRNELKKIKKVLSRNIGIEETKITEPKERGAIGELWDVTKGIGSVLGIKGNAIRTAQDIGTGLAMRGEGQRTIEAQTQAVDISRQLVQKAMVTTDPAEKKRLLDLSRQAEGQRIEPGFSKDIGKEYISRGLETATEIASMAEIPALVKVIPTLGKKLALIKSPSKAIGVIRDTAVKQAEKKGVTFGGSTIKKAAETYVEQDPLAAKLWKKIEPSIGKNIKPGQLMKKLDIWNKAYTSASKVGKSSKAGLYDVLARSAKEQIATKAPEVAKATRLFSRYYALKKMAGKSVFPATIGIAGGAVSTGLSKLLGLGGPR